MFKITILVDNQKSWVVPFATQLKERIESKHRVELIYSAKDVTKGDILFLIGCTKIVKKEILDLNKNNIVIHESELPKGRGWSPISWQVAEGINDIPVSIIEASAECDAGPVYILDYIKLDGTELYDEIKRMQGEKTIELALRYLDNYPNNPSKEQVGEPSFYERRTETHDCLDINKSIKKQFNRLRIADNCNYPAWFEMNGQKYILKIYKKQ